MASNSFGVSFVPGQSQNENGNGQNPTEPVQQAIKYLSLRLPKFTAGAGGAPILPGPLLGATGSAGNPFARSAVGQTQQNIWNPPPAPTQDLASLLALLPTLSPNPPAPPVALEPPPEREARLGPAPRPTPPTAPAPAPAPAPVASPIAPPQAAPLPKFRFKQPRPEPVDVENVARDLYTRAGTRFQRV